ncbi:MAG TPA: hypothetical protein VHK91_05080 [Flavisolibacter sp.]|jgi:hypothetical protein|nr:hypothetical protein [Flavisolibacter sp.]
MRSVKILLLLVCCTPLLSQAQLLKKLKDKANQVAEKIGEKKAEETTGVDNSQNGTNGSSGSTTGSTAGRRNNKGGAGLISTPPDVKENLTTAETSFTSAKYSEARYAIQQAMLGVELEIGQAILKSLPQAINELKYEASADQVTSTGWGWAGLTIYREYNKDDKQLRFSISNNAAWMQAINMYFNNVGYAQNTGGEQKWKQTKLHGLRAVIEYDANSGYKLSVPLGQTSMLIFEGVNFANEQEFMKSAEQIDVEKIRQQLGEK